MTATLFSSSLCCVWIRLTWSLVTPQACPELYRHYEGKLPVVKERAFHQYYIGQGFLSILWVPRTSVLNRTCYGRSQPSKHFQLRWATAMIKLACRKQLQSQVRLVYCTMNATESYDEKNQYERTNNDDLPLLPVQFSQRLLEATCSNAPWTQPRSLGCLSDDSAAYVAFQQT